MKIVVLSSRFPYPLEKGDKLRLYHQIRILSKHHDIHLISITEEKPSKSDLLQLKSICKSVTTFKISLFHKLLGLFFGIIKGLPMQTAMLYNFFTKKSIQKTIKTIQPDLIYCQLIRMAPFCNSLEYPKVLDYMDAFGIGMKRRADLSSGLLRILYNFEALRVIKYEKKLFDQFDGHTVISEQDKLLIDLEFKSDIAVVSNGIDLDYFQYNYNTSAEFDIAFIGNLGYLPNIEAANLLVTRINEEVLKLGIEPLKILIAGARPDDRVNKLANDHVTIKPWPRDIRESYLSAKIFVAPLLKGTGQQNKILEAMALGVPCITTTTVNNAIGATKNMEILLANTPSGFAKAIVDLLVNKRKQMLLSTRGRDFVEKHYDWNTSVQILSDIFVKIINSKNGTK